MTTLEHPPYSPDLASADFYLHPQQKSELKVRRCRIANDIIRNATEELKRLLRNVFQECFKELYSDWRKCIYAEGDYFEGNLA